MSQARHEVRNRPWLYTLLFFPLGLVLGIYFLVAHQLPDLTATHWTDKYPDQFTDTSVFVSTCIGLIVVGSVIGLIALSQSRKPGLLLTLLFVGSLLSWLTASVFIGSAVPTALAETPQSAVIGLWILPMIACSLIGLLPLWICGVYQSYAKELHSKRQARINQASGIATEQPKQPQPAQNGEFNETMKAPWWLWLLGIVIAGVGIFILIQLIVQPHSADLVSATFGMAISLIVCALVLGLCRVRVTMSDDRVRVSSAVFGFPLRTIKTNEIISVDSTEIDPMSWGGWGWRFFPGGSAVVLKRHEGLAFELKNSTRFAVTIPNSQLGAEKIRSLLPTDS